MTDLWGGLDVVPFEPRGPRRDPRDALARLKDGLDFVGHNLPRVHAASIRLHPYPDPWQRVRVPVDDEGTRLDGWLAPGDPAAPAVLWAPGTFQTKDDTTRRLRAQRLHRETGGPTLIVDLRGFGGSHATLGAGGHLEAQDLLRAAAWLRARSGCGRVTLLGESLGAASSLLAAAQPDADRHLTGVLAWSPYSDLAEQARYVGTNPGLRHPFYGIRLAYRAMVRLRTRGDAQSFAEFLRSRAADLGLEPEALLRLGSPGHHAHHIGVPTLVHHAEDDPIVPVGQARHLRDAARGNPLVRVRILPRGGHVEFHRYAPEWYWDTVLGFLSRLDPRPLTGRCAGDDRRTQR